MEAKVEAEVQQINTLHSGLTSTLACSALLAAALVGDSRVLARRGGRVRNDGLFEHPVLVPELGYDVPPSRM